MPVIVTTLHDPIALAATCRQLGLPAPTEGCVQLESREAFGRVVRLPGARFPIVCDTLTGLVAYHPQDNAFAPYRRIAQFVQSYYHVRARMRQPQRERNDRLTFARTGRALVAVGTGF